MGASCGGGCYPGFPGGCICPGGPIPMCFSTNTKMIVLENDKECIKIASEIRKGDLVLTFDGKEKVFTKVMDTKKNEGIFEFYEMKLKDGKNISVTGNHTMIVFEKDTKEIKFKYA